MTDAFYDNSIDLASSVLLPIASKGRGAKGRVDVFYVFLLTVCKDFAEDLILCEGVTWVILCGDNIRPSWIQSQACLSSAEASRMSMERSTMNFKDGALQGSNGMKWRQTSGSSLTSGCRHSRPRGRKSESPSNFPGIAAYKVFVSFRVFRCLNRKFRDFCDFCVTFRYSFALCFCSYSWYKIPEIIAELTKFTLYSHLNQSILAQMLFMWKIYRTFDPCNEVTGTCELNVLVIKLLKIRAAW